MNHKTIASLISAFGLAIASHAAPTLVTAPGTSAPPATLGGYTMTAFPDDARSIIADVSGVASPLGGTVSFSSDLSHREIGSGWATWSHGYTGDVYYTNGLTSITLTMPASTGAFYLYAEPNPFSVHSFSVYADDTLLGSLNIDGNAGAAYIGVYDTSAFSTIKIMSDVDFAIGEFGIASVVPEPSTYAMIAGLLALVGAFIYRRNKR